MLIADTVNKSIIDQINSCENEHFIEAFNNDHTPFQIVYFVLKNVVPMSDESAYKATEEIHLKGKSIVYTGNKEHCQKIGDALDKIRVQYEIH